MKKLFNSAGGVIAALALGVCVLPLYAAEPVVNAHQLGILERTVKFCSAVDPQVSKKLTGKLADMTKGVSALEIAKIRSSDDYKKAYAQMDGFVAQVDEHNAKVLCSDTAQH